MKRKFAITLVLIGLLAMVTGLVFALNDSPSESVPPDKAGLWLKNDGAEDDFTYEDMLEAMKDNNYGCQGFRGSGDNEAMNKWMKDLSEEDYEEMIDLMREAGFEEMSEMMESLGWDTMRQMHDDFGGRHGRGMMGEW